MNYKRKEVFSTGGGTQSACIAALIVKGMLPKPDITVIADTGYECQSTWDYMNAIVAPELLKIGVVVHRVHKSEWSNQPDHGMDYVSHNGNTLIIPAWTDESGSIGKLSGFSSKTWKVQPIDSYLSKKFGLTRSKYTKWIGFSRDEHRRATRMMDGKEYKKGLIRLPLIHDVPMTRHEVIQFVKNIGWPEPPRSRCYICPNQDDSEWREMKINRPEEFSKAVMFEAEIQQYDKCAWLHRSCTPLEGVDLSEEASLFEGAVYCSSGSCFT